MLGEVVGFAQIPKVGVGIAENVLIGHDGYCFDGLGKGRPRLRRKPPGDFDAAAMRVSGQARYDDRRTVVGRGDAELYAVETLVETRGSTLDGAERREVSARHADGLPLGDGHHALGCIHLHVFDYSESSFCHFLNLI